jgi:hypothetical protein
MMLIDSTGIQQKLQEEIEESKRAQDGYIDDTIYRLDHAKRIELINWVLECMIDPNIQICDLIESRMNEIINKINQMDSAIEVDPLHSELRILDWILNQVCSNEIKTMEYIGGSDSSNKSKLT